MTKQKAHNRCIISGKIVTANKEVILKSSLEEYLIKQGKTTSEAKEILKGL
jgi:hypothetical protein